MARWRLCAPSWGAAAGAIFGFAIAAALGLQEEAILVTALPGEIFGALATVRGMINTNAQTARPQLQRVLDRLSEVVQRDAAPDADPAPLRER